MAHMNEKNELILSEEDVENLHGSGSKTPVADSLIRWILGPITNKFKQKI